MDVTQAYQILNLKHESSFNEIKHAYRQLVLESHPDRNNSEQNGTKFKLVTEAYHTLKNNDKAQNAKMHSSQKYTDAKTKKEKTVTRTSWGAPPSDKIPEEDWGRYTRQTEQADPFFWKNYVSDFWKNYESKTNETKKQYDFEIIQEKEPKLFSSVDHSRCIGCCSCETIAPGVFSVDKISKMNPKSNVINQRGAKMDKILDAAQTCPTKAIKVEEQQTKKRLYPY